MSKENHYVDNERLYLEVVGYQNARKLAEETGKEEPIMSNFIGECIIKIATKFAYRPNFINYSYRDEMIADGIEVCITGIRKFNHEQYQNVFSYLTQCCFYAFLSRIKMEKKQQYVRSEMMKSFEVETFEIQAQDLDEEFKTSFMEFINSNMNVDGEFLKNKKPPKVKVGPLEEFMGA